MIEKLRNLVWDEEGQGLVEYALILGAIAIAIFAILGGIGDKLEGIFTKVRDELPATSTTTP